MTVISRGSRQGVRVNADPWTQGWGRSDEPYLREKVLSEIASLLADPAGLSDIEVAKRVGVSNRAIMRYRQRQVPPIPSCYERRRLAGHVTQRESRKKGR